ncbi:hypothetical protein [Methanobacterium sp. SMA-27]|uniref:hypothetical protein n=1 Tax=Methanobacterium sp. SMA-27 TaxID=1495336 RepID=UPI00064FB104|nr:hypothetical protein [Methanobacterium sp. SMA-27]
MSEETIKKIKDPTMLLIWEINGRIAVANRSIRNGRSIGKNNIKMFDIDKKSLMEIEEELKDVSNQSLRIWATNLREKLEILLGENED